MDNKKFNFIITNLFTLLRLISIFALIPVYIYYGGYYTFLLCTLSFLTDFIDGFLARSLQSSTFFGSLFDAFSDKLFLIINLFLLMRISPIAIILVILELGIAFIQSHKYNRGMNIKSNIFGKIKMWVAGIIISLSYLLTDKLRATGEVKLFVILFLPLIISEIITLVSYVVEYYKYKNIKQVCNENDLEKEIGNASFKEILFEHSYYEKYKDYGNLKLIKTLSKK